METSDGTEWDWDRIWKIRARLSTENSQSYNYISGLYSLRPTVRLYNQAQAKLPNREAHNCARLGLRPSLARGLVASSFLPSLPLSFLCSPAHSVRACGAQSFFLFFCGNTRTSCASAPSPTIYNQICVACVENISLRSVYDTTKRTRDGDMLTAREGQPVRCVSFWSCVWLSACVPRWFALTSVIWQTTRHRSYKLSNSRGRWSKKMLYVHPLAAPWDPPSPVRPSCAPRAAGGWPCRLLSRRTCAGGW
jgi:hypothetical protein